jgi:hypothetical protein
MSIKIESIFDIEKNYNWKIINSILAKNSKDNSIDYDNLLYLLFTSWWVLADWGLFIDEEKPNSIIEYDELKRNFLNNIELIKKELAINYKFELALGLAMATIPIPFMTDETDDEQYDKIIKVGEQYCNMAYRNNQDSLMCKYFSKGNNEKVSERKKFVIKDEINHSFIQGTLLNEYLTSIIEE